MNQLLKYTCPKCGNRDFEIDELWIVGSIWTRIFQIHNRRFTYVSCKLCHFTELYKVAVKDILEAISFRNRKSEG